MQEVASAQIEIINVTVLWDPWRDDPPDPWNKLERELNKLVASGANIVSVDTDALMKNPPRGFKPSTIVIAVTVRRVEPQM